MPIEDARGFALADANPKIIVVNSKDQIEARIFTLLHEFAHILLGETSISIPDLRSNNTIEKWVEGWEKIIKDNPQAEIILHNLSK